MSIKRRLLSPTNNSPHYHDGPSSMISDQSDSERNELKSNMIPGIDDSDSDDSFGRTGEDLINLENLRDDVELKEEYIKEFRQNALAVQQKFIWELSFAIKQYLVEEKGPETEEGIHISQYSVQKMLETAIDEEPDPSTWLSWIEKKFAQDYC